MWFKVCMRYHLISDSKFCIGVLEVSKDHIHCMITYKPQVSITSIVRRLKQISMHNAQLQYWELLSKHFWKERTFQSDWYFCSSIWNASPETIRRYIENQW